MLRQLQKFPIQDINNAAPDIAKALEQFYDLGKPVEIRASEFGDTNRNFHIVRTPHRKITSTGEIEQLFRLD